MTKIAVVDVDQATRSRLAMQLGEQVRAYPTVEAFSEDLDGSAVVLVLGPSCAAAPGLVVAAELIQAHQELGAILIAGELTTDLFQRAIRVGVRDVLAAPVDTAQLSEAVRRVGETLSPARGSAGSHDESDGEIGRVITVFSTKGGAGKSMVASNLAVTLAQRTDKLVVLLDADLQFGDIAVMLKMAPQHTIVDAVASIDNLDAALLQELLAQHSSGLQTMRLLDTPMSKIHLVLNRANSKVKLDVGEVERTLQVKAESLLPSDVVVPQSINKGTPVVIDAPKSGIAKALEQLADMFLPAPSKARKRR